MSRAGLRRQALVAAFVLAAEGVAAASEEIRVERVRFERGASSAVVEGSIQGDEIVDYVLGARKGQSMNVSMATNNGANYFNILAPGENDVAMFNGSVAENQYEGVLPETGDYKIRVYLMRSAARRNEVAKYRLEMIVSPATAEPSPSGGESSRGDAKVAGTNYHATGNVPCSMGGGQPTGSCSFGVEREGNGSGIVTVTKPDGQTRAIFFEKGRATGCDASQADPGEFSASREGDLNIVRIGKERYEIPDAVISGG
jgi:hypothetical protein